VKDVPEIAAAKRALRASLLETRRGRSALELDRARVAVADTVLASAEAGRWRCVAAYEPMRTEPGSAELLARLAELGIEILVPVTLPDHDLDWARWQPGRVSSTTGTPFSSSAPARLGVDAVAGAQAVLVPALAVGLDGARLGRGGGSYDRALLRCNDDARRIALLFDGEILDGMPTGPWDVPVHAAITPTGRVELGGPA
jgi:5-formyltetrahydrofolate cyclo-ligase